MVVNLLCNNGDVISITAVFDNCATPHISHDLTGALAQYGVPWREEAGVVTRDGHNHSGTGVLPHLIEKILHQLSLLEFDCLEFPLKNSISEIDDFLWIHWMAMSA